MRLAQQPVTAGAGYPALPRASLLARVDPGNRRVGPLAVGTPLELVCELLEILVVSSLENGIPLNRLEPLIHGCSMFSG